MGKWIRRIIFLVLLAVFLYSVGSIGLIMYQYRESDKRYEEAADKFVSSLTETEASVNGDVLGTAPLEVDFEALWAVNPDIVGWIYCEDTVINYPVLHGTDNDFYLHHTYEKSYSASASIFVEAINDGHFQDANTIIYGHHMKNGSMFGDLDNWEKQEYYDQHPVMWLLTPEQDYRIDILGGYTTSASSDTYMTFTKPGEELNAYLADRLALSVIETEAEPEEGARYVLLSTCAYVFDNARFVIHGKLVPVNSAGGILKAN